MSPRIPIEYLPETHQPIVVVCLSDTHQFHEVEVPEGDLLLFAGDCCNYGILSEVLEFNEFLASLPHLYKVVVAGNHDWPFEKDNIAARRVLAQAIYLQDEGVRLRIRGRQVNIWGTPWVSPFHDWAFNLPAELRRVQFSKIPEDLDFLVTHSPPYGKGDRERMGGQSVGCHELLAAVTRAQPRNHIFGDIHEGYGYYHDSLLLTHFWNVSIMSDDYRPIHEPVVIRL